MEIRLYDKNNDMISMDFPMNVLEIQDAIDWLHISPEEPIVRFRISKYDNIDISPGLCEKELTADIYKLNLFAERYKQFDFVKKAALESLLITKPQNSFDDILLMIYGLDSVSVWPCADLIELGEMAIENHMLPELENCPEEVVEFLSTEYVGEVVCDRNNGVFVDNVYCEPDCYEPPDINIQIGRPENCVFRLLIAPTEWDRKNAEWLSLPCSGKQLDEMADAFGMKIEDMKCLEFQSALPGLAKDTSVDMVKIGDLNTLAENISDMYRRDFLKLKAVMNCENITEISAVPDCIARLDEYDFNYTMTNYSDFGIAYLNARMPADFSFSAIEKVDFSDFGEKILDAKQGSVTPYGILSGRGQKLYTTITEPISSEELTEEQDQEQDIEMELN